jgi:hypothetical protein
MKLKKLHISHYSFTFFFYKRYALSHQLFIKMNLELYG